MTRSAAVNLTPRVLVSEEGGFTLSLNEKESGVHDRSEFHVSWIEQPEAL